MPIEIRELVIKATVTDDAGAGSSNAGPAGGNNSVPPGEDMMKDCLDKIMDAIKDRNER